MLRYREEDFIAVFTHGQFMRAVLWLLLTNPMKIDEESMGEFRTLLEETSIPNGSILPVKLCKRGETQVGKISTSHIAGVSKTLLSGNSQKKLRTGEYMAIPARGSLSRRQVFSTFQMLGAI